MRGTHGVQGGGRGANALCPVFPTCISPRLTLHLIPVLPQHPTLLWPVKHSSNSLPPCCPTCKQGWCPLHSATSAGHEPVARLLISLSADVNAATAQQRTALHYAASKGQRELVELLLQHGALVRLDGPFGCALHAWAAASPSHPHLHCWL